MKPYAGRDNEGRIVLDFDRPADVTVYPPVRGLLDSTMRWLITPSDAEELAHELLALAYDHEANRKAYRDDPITEDAIDQAADASGEPDFGGAGLGSSFVGPSEAFLPSDTEPHDEEVDRALAEREKETK